MSAAVHRAGSDGGGERPGPGAGAGAGAGVGALPKVSCLIVTYSFERFIVRAIESALAQDYPPELLQIVVVDDGSPDRTPELVRPYSDRVRYVRQPNRGLVAAFNRGLREIDGDVLMLLSGDDEWPPSRVRLHAEFLSRHPEVGLVYGDMEVIDAGGATIEPSFWRATGHVPQRGDVLGRLLRGNFISGGAMSVRMSLADRFAPLPADCAWEDWWIATRVAAVAAVDYTPQCVYRYRWHGNNMNLGTRGRRFAELLVRELPFRRRLLAEVELERLAAEDVYAGAVALVRSLAVASERTSTPATELAPVTDADRERAGERLERARAALAAGAWLDALADTTRALAADPHDPSAVALLERCAQALGLVTQASVPASAASGAAAQRPAPLGDDVRAVVLLADGRELAAAPELIAAYARVVGDDDPVTLVIALPPDDGAVVAALERAVSAAGADGPGSPDLLALPLPDDGWETLAASAHGFYGPRPSVAALAGLSAVSPADLTAFLARVVERRKRAQDTAGAAARTLGAGTATDGHRAGTAADSHRADTATAARTATA